MVLWDVYLGKPRFKVRRQLFIGLEKHSGGYFANCKLASSSRASRNEEDAKRLWELSEELTNTRFDF